jgi:hypothetical protein
MALAQKQACRPVEQNIRPRNESTQLQLSVFLIREPKAYSEEKTAFSTNGTVKTSYLHVED